MKNTGNTKKNSIPVDKYKITRITEYKKIHISLFIHIYCIIDKYNIVNKVNLFKIFFINSNMLSLSF